MKKALLVLAVLVVLFLVVAGNAAQPVEASGRVCPSPGTGLPGALNMIRDAKMGEIMDAHTAWQGDRGMETAVINSACD